MDDRRAQDVIQRAVDAALSGLQGNPYRVQRVLSAARQKGERITMKRKFSVALVLAIALALASVTALAVGLTNYFAGFKALEKEYGEYDQWPAAAQIKLVDMMLDQGILTAADAPGWPELSGADREAVARQALDGYFGTMIFVDTDSVMERMLGPIEQWTDAQRAMYTDLLVSNGEQRDDSPYYMMPLGSDLNREQAVRKAKEYLADAFALTPEDYDGLPVSAYFSAASYNEEGLPADEPYWSVYLGEGESWRYVRMTRGGELLSMSLPDE